MRKLLLSCCISWISCLPALSQSTVVVDPNIRYQTLEGWGVSLAWWANAAGGWSDAQIDTLCTWLTSPTGLNMNIFRFNIAGEENPAHNHFRYTAQLQGYKVSSGASYDYTRDLTQRKILLKLKQKRADCIFEAIAYSPPYWMTVSGCTSGNASGSTNNLTSGYEDDFADYLTDVVKYYHDNYGVTFRTLAPINEPSSSWWTANGTQAGCYYSTAQQVALFSEIYSKLQSKSMLSYCTLSGVDASNAQESIVEMQAFANEQILSKITQINTHGYTTVGTTDQYDQLHNLAVAKNKNVWMSESGPLSLLSPGSLMDTIQGFANNLLMTDALIRDMRHLKPTAWCDWQALSMENRWSFVQFDSNATFTKVPNFYTRMQVSRFIKPGYTFVHSNVPATLAATNPAKDTVVLVINNSSLTDKSYTIDLSLFGSTGSAAKLFRTTTGMSGGHYGASTYQVHTYQTKTGLTNGTYAAKAWVKSSGSQSQCYIQAKDFGGTAITTNISRSVAWTQVTITGINVSNGQCTIDFYSNGTSGKGTWIEFDDVELYRTSTPTTNVLTNGNFEQTNVDGPTLPGWISSNDVASDFLQSLSHGNNEECLQLSNLSISGSVISFTAQKKSINTLLIPVTVSTITPLASGNYRITAKHTSKDISVAAASLTDGAVVEQWTPLGQENQVFNVQKTPTGYKILPSYNEKVLTVDGYSNANGAAINQWTDYEQLNQRFSIIDIGGGYHKIVSLSSGKCLAVTGNGTANGDDIVQWDWMNYDNEKWTFTPVALPSPIADDTYNIKARHSSKVMTVQAESSENDAIIEQWTDLCQDNQKFVLHYTDSGYTIKPVYNNKMVTVENLSIADGAGVTQYQSAGIFSQYFEIKSVGSGYYKIINRYTNKCLAVTGNGMNNGDDVIQWQWLSGYNNFQWTFNEISCGLRSSSSAPQQDIAARNETDVMYLKLYPNPASGKVAIEYAGIENATIQIYDMAGQLRLTQRGDRKLRMIQLDKTFSSGTYLVKITGTNGQLTKMLIVQ